MTSDFDNDEIKDSAFPVEFNDETVSLDLYGVWVKSGPRDASVPEAHSPSALNAAATETPAESGFDTDISGLPELPDFDDFEMSGDQAETFTEEPLSGVADLPEETVSLDSPVAEVPAFEEESREDVSPVAESTVSEEISFEDIPFGEPLAETVTPEFSPDEFSDLTILAEPESDTVIEEFTEDIVMPEEIPEEAAPVPDFTSAELPPEEKESEVAEVGEFADFDLAAFETTEDLIAEIPEETEIPVAETAPAAEPEAAPSADFSADDFSGFLDDLNAGAIIDSSAVSAVPSGNAGASGSEDLDLDSFISSFNETGGASHDESEKLFDDVEPVDIDLEFDESFISDSEKIKATGASVSESEFFNSEFGVELIDETTGEESNEFDDIFKTVTDIDSPASESAAVAGAVSISGADMESANEFDDLLASLDMAPAPASASSRPAAQTVKAKSYDLSVTEEDGYTAAAPSVVESSPDDEMDVSLFGSGSGAEKISRAETSPLPPVSPVSAENAVSGQEPDSYRGSPEISESEMIPDLSEIPAGEPEMTPVAEDIAIDIPEIKDYNDTLSGLDTEVEPEVEPATEAEAAPAAESFMPADFDDISAVEQELNEMVPDTEDENMASNDKSTELLLKIADELSSIKREISTLKTELAGYKAAGSVPESGEGEAVPTPENSGFFSDDDPDETIALTGDELNNILITADFTEEKNDENAPEFTIPEELPESFGIGAELPDVSAVAAETAQPADESAAAVAEAEEFSIPESLPENMFDMPDLDAGNPVEVSHVNNLNEDISYLEGSGLQEPDLDNVAIEEPELEIIDFDDEKLEEPELAEFNIDFTDIESGFPAEQDVSIPETADTDIPTDTETVGDVLAATGFSDDVFGTAPAMVVEPLPEIELPPEEPVTPEESVSGILPEEGLTEEILSEADIPQAESTIPETSSVEEPVPVSSGVGTLPLELKDEIKSVLSYMDQLLESLPEDKIEEFARSEHFEVYKKLFEELGIS